MEFIAGVIIMEDTITDVIITLCIMVLCVGFETINHLPIIVGMILGFRFVQISVLPDMSLRIPDIMIVLTIMPIRELVRMYVPIGMNVPMDIPDYITDRIMEIVRMGIVIRVLKFVRIEMNVRVVI